MKAPLLVDLLNQESTSFQRIDQHWRPQNLFQDQQTLSLLKDMTKKLEALKASEEELKQLDRAELLLKLVRRMGFIVKRSNFVRRANHLAFGQAVAEFYTAYGEVLRYLKIDQARGQLQPV